MGREMKDDENGKYVRELNNAAERDAELCRVKTQLWRRIAAAMRNIPGAGAKWPSCDGPKTNAPFSPTRPTKPKS